jgi:hypothetical protein
MDNAVERFSEVPMQGCCPTHRSCHTLGKQLLGYSCHTGSASSTPLLLRVVF